MCASSLELDEARGLLSLLESAVGQSDPHELIRMADKKLGMDFRFGAVRHLADARRVYELVDHVADPFVRCSFRCAYSCALNLSAQYKEGRAEAERLLDDATQFRIDPALPYAHSDARSWQRRTRCTIRVRTPRWTLRSWSHGGAMTSLEYRAPTRAGFECWFKRVDLSKLASSNRRIYRIPLNAMRGEVIASRGLALASVGRLEEARRLGSEALHTTGGVEARVLAAAINAVCAVLGRTPGMLDEVELMIETAFDAGAVDLVVTAYRGNPDLLVAMLSSPRLGTDPFISLPELGMRVFRQRSPLNRSLRSSRSSRSQGVSARSTNSSARGSRTPRSPSGSSSAKRRSRFTSTMYSTRLASGRGLLWP